MAKKPTFKSKNSIGSSGEMVGGPMKKGQGPSPTKGKKPAMKIDIMLAKAMPGVGPKGIPTKKGDAMPMAKKNPKSGGKNAPMSGNMKGGKKPC